MKQFRLLILAVFLIATLTMTVLAHPGRTDANGGHTDHSTGEYHYHHGYSAHQHWDMDGDGDLDCPYQFANPNQESNSPSNSYTGKSKNDELSDWLKIFGNFTLPIILGFAFFGIIFLYEKLKEAIQQHRYKKAQQEENNIKEN